MCTSTDFWLLYPYFCHWGWKELEGCSWWQLEYQRTFGELLKHMGLSVRTRCESMLHMCSLVPKTVIHDMDFITCNWILTSYQNFWLRYDIVAKNMYCFEIMIFLLLYEESIHPSISSRLQDLYYEWDSKFHKGRFACGPDLPHSTPLKTAYSETPNKAGYSKIHHISPSLQSNELQTFKSLLFAFAVCSVFLSGLGIFIDSLHKVS